MGRPTTAEERELLLGAVAAVIAERGFVDLTAEAVAARAELPESAFHLHFAGVEEAAEAAHQAFFELFRTRLVRACDAQPGWPLKVKVGIGVALDLAAAAPAQMLLLTFDSLTGSREIARRSAEARDQLARLLAAGRAETPGGASLPMLTEPVLVGGLLSVVAAQLVAGEAQRLPGLAPELVMFTLLPYLGAEEAARVARRPKSKPEGRDPESPREAG
jgi:AcrR family transcriptional regulator